MTDANSNRLLRRRAVLVGALSLTAAATLMPGKRAAAQDQEPVEPGEGVAPVELNVIQRETLGKINTYFNEIRTMQGRFTQFGPDGGRSDGVFYLARPGRIRFRYARPSTLDVISDGVDVIVKDRHLQTQDLYPLSQTPLKFLLADAIDLTTEAQVRQVSIEPDLVTVVLQQETVFGSGKLTLLFDRFDNTLKQWVVTDAQGLETTVVIFETEQNVAINNDTFYINKIPVLGTRGRN